MFLTFNLHVEGSDKIVFSNKEASKSHFQGIPAVEEYPSSWRITRAESPFWAMSNGISLQKNGLSHSNQQGIILLKPIANTKPTPPPPLFHHSPRRRAFDGGCDGNIGRQVGAIDLEFAANLKNKAIHCLVHTPSSAWVVLREGKECFPNFGLLLFLP